MGAGGIAAVVAHKYHYGVIRLIVCLEPVHQVAEAFVHALDERCVSCFFIGQTFTFVAVEVARVAIDGHMYGVVSHIQEKRLIIALCLIEGGNSFASECFGDECACLPIFFESGHRHQRGGLAVGIVTIIEFAVICGKSAGCVACYIHIEAEMMRILARSVDGAPMCLAAVYGVIAGIMQQLHHRGGHIGVWRAGSLANAVIVPFRWFYHIVWGIYFAVALQGPVGDTMPSGIGAGEHTASAGRTDSRSIGLREFHALCGKSLHIGCVITLVERCGLAPEGHRCVLPSHIIY